MTRFIEDGDVCAHFAFGVEEVAGNALRVERLFDVAPEAAGGEAHRQAFTAELVDHARDIDPLSAGIGTDGLHTNRVAGDEFGQHESVGDGRVTRNGNYHTGPGKI